MIPPWALACCHRRASMVARKDKAPLKVGTFLLGMDKKTKCRVVGMGKKMKCRMVGMGKKTKCRVAGMSNKGYSSSTGSCWW